LPEKRLTFRRLINQARAEPCGGQKIRKKTAELTSINGQREHGGTIDLVMHLADVADANAPAAVDWLEQRLGTSRLALVSLAETRTQAVPPAEESLHTILAGLSNRPLADPTDPGRKVDGYGNRRLLEATGCRGGRLPASRQRRTWRASR